MQPGREMRWDALAAPQASGEAVDLFKSLVFRDEQWDFRTLKLDEAEALAAKAERGVINARDANLKPFFSRGGKLLLYHGWNDQLVAPQTTIEYYEAVRKAVGTKTADQSIKLFMMPGVTHCQGGDGPSTFDKMAALEPWVEHGDTPARILASHVVGGFLRRGCGLENEAAIAAEGGNPALEVGGVLLHLRRFQAGRAQQIRGTQLGHQLLLGIQIGRAHV